MQLLLQSVMHLQPRFDLLLLCYHYRLLLSMLQRLFLRDKYREHCWLPKLLYNCQQLQVFLK